MPLPLRIATAGWSIPSALSDRFDSGGTHLQRYAHGMNAVEIDSSFYRPHRTSTYERWAASTPAGFRFAVKLPRAITHDAKLRSTAPLLDAFLAQVAGLGPKLGVLLVQLAPSLAFDGPVVDDFIAALRDRAGTGIAIEPRYASWFTPQADAALARLRVARVAADPARVPAAASPGGWIGDGDDGARALVYFRWHGSPRLYWSRYAPDWIAARRRALERWRAAECWCVFDNTAAGAALANALEFADASNSGADVRTTHGTKKNGPDA